MKDFSLELSNRRDGRIQVTIVDCHGDVWFSKSYANKARAEKAGNNEMKRIAFYQGVTK